MTVGEDRSACESIDLLCIAFRGDSLKERREGGGGRGEGKGGERGREGIGKGGEEGREGRKGGREGEREGKKR